LIGEKHGFYILRLVWNSSPHSGRSGNGDAIEAAETSPSFDERARELRRQAPEPVTGDPRTRSGIAVDPLPTHDDLDGFDPVRDLGLPGEFPYTRGTSPYMYREQLWVMGQYSGSGSPAETRERISRLLRQGQHGFSIALDLPTQLGLDSDDPRALGEVGRVGVPIDSLQDMVDMLDGIPFEEVRQIRTTANAIGPIAVALFVAAAERLGHSPDSFKVMLQNDVLKEYVARGTYIFPPEHGFEFSVDVIEYCARHLPHWEPIEFCGYHIRDAGSNAVQELAIAVANGLEYISSALSRGLEIDQFGHNLYLFLSAHLDLFEEVAKLRASRRLWARLMRDRFDADEESCRLNLFVYTLGSPQTADEQLNNIVRISYQALAAVLGGVQTLATTAYDEAVQLPSEESVRVSLRTQQILAYETGVTRSADPLAGSYLVEGLTDAMEAATEEYLEQIAERGGALAALKSGWLEAEIDAEAYRQHQAIERGEQVVVGLNRFRGEDHEELRHRAGIDPSLEAEQCRRVAAVRARRDQQQVDDALGRLAAAARASENTVPHVLDAVRAEATIGEITTSLKSVWGVHSR
jgi:methylmalonyl-CoA mutase N-terminal domain/subunit